ncbi:MAG: ATP-binding protein [bacterium]|nr:MAG: ATP-binding protein [bacterium]
MNQQPLPFKPAMGFTRERFDKNFPTKHLFMSQQIKQLFAQLKQLLQRREIALISGEIGTGKSTTIRAFTDQLEQNRFDVAYIADPTIGIRGMLNSVAIQLHLEGGYFKWQLLHRWQNRRLVFRLGDRRNLPTG